MFNMENAENRPYVYAMRIYLNNDHMPLADLVLSANGDNIITIHYDVIKERDPYFVNAYTLIFDDRTKNVDFDDFMRYIRGEIK